MAQSNRKDRKMDDCVLVDEKNEKEWADYDRHIYVVERTETVNDPNEDLIWTRLRLRAHDTPASPPSPGANTASLPISTVHLLVEPGRALRPGDLVRVDFKVHKRIGTGDARLAG